MGPPHVAKAFPIKETRASRLGLNYQAANGTKIKNYGQKEIKGKNDESNDVSMTIQCADVKKVLGSVGRMNEAENTVIFSKGRSVIIKDPNSEIAKKAISMAKKERITELRRDKGVFKFDVWVPSGDNRPQVIAGIDQSFTWLEGDLM